MEKHTYRGKLKNGEDFFTDDRGHICVEKDHLYIVQATIEEEREARVLLAKEEGNQ